jgi:hypothetical protein
MVTVVFKFRKQYPNSIWCLNVWLCPGQLLASTRVAHPNMNIRMSSHILSTEDINGYCSLLVLLAMCWFYLLMRERMNCALLFMLDVPSIYYLPLVEYWTCIYCAWRTLSRILNIQIVCMINYVMLAWSIAIDQHNTIIPCHVFVKNWKYIIMNRDSFDRIASFSYASLIRTF